MDGNPNTPFPCVAQAEKVEESEAEPKKKGSMVRLF